MITRPWKLFPILAMGSATAQEHLSAARGVIAARNGGDPAGPLYRDQVERWLRGDFHPMEGDLESTGERWRETPILEPSPTAGER